VPRTPQPTTAHSDVTEDTLMADEILPRNKTAEASLKIVRSNRGMVKEDGSLSRLFIMTATRKVWDLRTNVQWSMVKDFRFRVEMALGKKRHFLKLF
jgi:hypothetical protein